MPALADMQAAVPKCPRMKMKRQGLGMVNDVLCGVPMRYVAVGNVWACPRCLHKVKGLLLAEAHEQLSAAA